MTFDVTVRQADGTTATHRPRMQTLRLLAELEPLEDAVFAATASLNEARAVLAHAEDAVQEAAVQGDVEAARRARDGQLTALRAFSVAQQGQLRARLAILAARLEPPVSAEELEGGFDVRDLERMEEALSRPTPGPSGPDGSMN